MSASDSFVRISLQMLDVLVGRVAEDLLYVGFDLARLRARERYDLPHVLPPVRLDDAVVAGPEVQGLRVPVELFPLRLELHFDNFHRPSI